MHKDQLESHLANQTYDFEPAFSSMTMHQISAIPKIKLPDYKWLITGIAASLIFCLAVIYVQDGDVSYEHLLGISEDSQEIIEYINYL